MMADNILEYNGYYGSIEPEDGYLYGKLLYIKSLITYEADTMAELKVAFRESVEDYKSVTAG